VVVGSFAAQAQLTYALPALLLFAVSLGFLLASRVRVPRRTLVLAAAAVLVCWSLPLADEVVHRPGNLEQIARVATADVDTFGWRVGWHSLEHTVGVPPWWVRPPRDGLERLADVGFAPGALMTVTAAALLAALTAALAAALRRGERELAAGLALALALCAAAAAVTARSPTEHGLFSTIAYTLWWTSIAGMFAWVMLGWAAVNLLRRLRPVEALGPGAALGVAVVAAVGIAVAAGEDPDPRQHNYRPIAHVLERVRAAVAPGPTVRVSGPSPAQGLAAGSEVDVVAAIAYELRREGVDLVTDDVIGLGHRYDVRARRYPRVVRVEPDRPGSGVAGRVIARAVLPDAVPPNHRLVVTLEP
jgi:hypothetical protein